MAACAKNPQLESAVRKIIADACASVVFELLNYIDGTGDPKTGEWTGIDLVDHERSNEVRAMLHDDFFDKYWTWREMRPGKKWTLDILDS